MDFEDALKRWWMVWVIGWPGGAAALHWGTGWPWWWAVLAPLIPGFVAMLGICGLVAFICNLVDWARRGVTMDFEDTAENGVIAFLVIGWFAGSAALHCWLGWPWWWAFLLPPVPAFLVAMAICGLITLVCELVETLFWARRARAYAAPPLQDEMDDFEEEDSGPKPTAQPARAVPVMDELSKKLFAQLDDPMPGQRSNALEMLRARLAKDGLTFHGLLHKFESRHG